MPIVPQSAFQFCGEFYTTVSPTFDASEGTNLYYEPGIRSSKSPGMLVGTPGLTLYGTLPHSPVRALWAGNGRLFAVGGTHVYEISANGYSVVTDFGAIPGSVGVGPCKIVAGGVYPANQLLVLDSSVAKIFYVNPVGPVVSLVFSGFDLEYLDTFFFAASSTIQNRINASATGDGTTWDPLSLADRTGVIDAVVGIAQTSSNLAIFGQKNTEFWYDPGNPTFPLARITGSTMSCGALANVGFIATFTVAKLNNSLIWFGLDERGVGVVFMLNGFTPVRISNYAIEQLIAQQASINSATAFTYQEDGHTFYVLNFATLTVAYDLTTQMWHRRGYLNGSTLERGRADNFACVPTNNGATNFVGDYGNGNIYIQSINATSDAGATIRRVRTAPHVSNSNQWLTHEFLQMDMDIGAASAFLTWSNDGGLTFTGGTGLAMPTIGTVTNTGIKTVKQWQLGHSRDRVYRVTITSSAEKVRISNAYLSVSGG